MKRRKPYAEAFKQAAVNLVPERGMRVTHVARDVAVRLDTLQRWLRHARSATHPTTSEAARVDVARLRRANEPVRMERASVQKARGIFARMPQ